MKSKRDQLKNSQSMSALSLPQIRLSTHVLSLQDSDKISLFESVKVQEFHIGESLLSKKMILEMIEPSINFLVKKNRTDKIMIDLNLVVTTLPSGERFNETRCFINSLAGLTSSNILNVLHENKAQEYYSYELNQGFLIIQILQLHYCMGIIAEPTEVLSQYFPLDWVEQLKEQVRIDETLFNIIKTDFNGIQDFFNAKNWKPGFGSPVDLLYQIMEQRFLKEAGMPSSAHSANHTPLKTQKITRSMFFRFLNNRSSQQEENELYSTFANPDAPLLLKLLYTVKCRRKYDKKLDILAMLLIEQFKERPLVYERYLWRRGDKYLYTKNRGILPCRFE